MEREREREREAGLFSGFPNSLPLMANPMHCSHPPIGRDCMSHCLDIEINAVTVFSIQSLRTHHITYIYAILERWLVPSDGSVVAF